MKWEVKGFDNVYVKFDRQVVMLAGRCREALEQILTLLNTEFRGPKTGREYYIRNRNGPGWVKYRASAIGEYPAIKTGKLRQNIFIEVLPVSNGKVVARMYVAGVKYARELENSMGRPFIKRILSEHKGLVIRILQQKGRFF